MESPSAQTADLTTVLLESAMCPRGKRERLKEAMSLVLLAAHHSNALLPRGSQVLRELCPCAAVWGVFLRVFAVAVCSGDLVSCPQLLLPLGCRVSPALARDRGSGLSGAPGEFIASSRGKYLLSRVAFQVPFQTSEMTSSAGGCWAPDCSLQPLQSQRSWVGPSWGWCPVSSSGGSTAAALPSAQGRNGCNAAGQE